MILLGREHLLEVAFALFDALRSGSDVWAGVFVELDQARVAVDGRTLETGRRLRERIGSSGVVSPVGVGFSRATRSAAARSWCYGGRGIADLRLRRDRSAD